MVEIEDLKGVGDITATKLKEAGFDTLEKLAIANIDDLNKLTSISKNKLIEIIELAKNEIEYEPFNLEKELKKEKKYLQAGFPLYLSIKGYDVNTQDDYDLYMKKYKEA